MATKQTDDSAVTATSTKNDGGAAINVGTKTTLLDNRQSSSVHEANGVFASTPKDDANADEARAAGVFAFNNDRGVIRRVTTKLSNVSNTVLQSAAAVPANVQNVHATTGTVITDLTTAIRDGRWNAFSGSFVPVLSGVDANYGNDTEATVSRSNQGQFAYKHGAPLAIQDDYPAKNG